MQETLTHIVVGTATLIALVMMWRGVAQMIKKGKKGSSGCGCSGECAHCQLPLRYTQQCNQQHQAGHSEERANKKG